MLIGIFLVITNVINKLTKIFRKIYLFCEVYKITTEII